MQSCCRTQIAVQLYTRLQWQRFWELSSPGRLFTAHLWSILRREGTFSWIQPAARWNGGALRTILLIISNIMGEDFGRPTDWFRNAIWTSYHLYSWCQWTINSHGHYNDFGQICPGIPCSQVMKVLFDSGGPASIISRKVLPIGVQIDHDHKTNLVTTLAGVMQPTGKVCVLKHQTPTITMMWASQFFSEEEKYFESMHFFTKSYSYPDYQIMGGIMSPSFGASSFLFSRWQSNLLTNKGII